MGSVDHLRNFPMQLKACGSVGDPKDLPASDKVDCLPMKADAKINVSLLESLLIQINMTTLKSYGEIFLYYQV